MRVFAWLLLVLTPCTAAELLELKRIWDQAAHNAFTDLVRWRGRWYCAFREGQGHVSPDGALRVLSSRDAARWAAAALITSKDSDLRDPKLAITPDNRLMLTTAGALHPPSAVRHVSMVWFSRDGRSWSGPERIGEDNFWLWRVVCQRGSAYSVGYHTVEPLFTRLYHSRDGRRFEIHVEKLFEEGYPNESAIVFQPDGTALCLLRRDRGPATAQLGSARPPYREWTWKDLGVRMGGPQALRLKDGRIVVATRLYDGKVRTSLGWLDAAAGKFTEFLALPSGGDTSYPGLVMHQGLLHVSYYSTHEGKTSIYLAKVRL